LELVIQTLKAQGILHLGNCDVIGSAPLIVFGKRSSNSTAYRNALIRNSDQFFFIIADYRNTNAGPNNATAQIAIAYSAPSFKISLAINGS
jgi:hypothetical protein